MVDPDAAGLGSVIFRDPALGRVPPSSMEILPMRSNRNLILQRRLDSKVTCVRRFGEYPSGSSLHDAGVRSSSAPPLARYSR